MSQPTDAHYMRLALALAERGRGGTSPNPMVGAVVVDSDGVVVGRGAHAFAGGPHAEVHALHDAGARAVGATLYCTLEPCSHTGRTPPCAPRVVEAGIARVVTAAGDPNPLVSGRGLAYLRAHGIEVTENVLRETAERQNRAFLSVMRRGRPYVTLKIAISLDGRIAERPGTRTALTSAAANRLIHRQRAEIDAIAVGSGTVMADDPLLTPRGAYRRRPLVRVIFDARLRTPPTARVLSTLDAGPVIIMSTAASAETAPERVRALTDAGASLELLQQDANSSVPIEAATRRLAERGVTSLLIEGGAALHGAAWHAGIVDCVQMYVAPRCLGPGGQPWLPSSELPVAALRDLRAAPVGDDVLIEGYVHRVD
jgi:diaminohydroxyphosphoribosylaminopyrimidine deaminase/5-amino-6-(5-phosphoribosylamino)uracil reductase